MQKKIIIVIFIFWFISLISGFIGNTIFIPSITYKYFSYIYSFSIIGFLVYKIYFDNPNLKSIKSSIFTPLVFIVFFHLSLVGLLSGLPNLLKYMPSNVVNIEKIVVEKQYSNGRPGNFCYYQIDLEHSFYYGRICTTKEVLDSVNTGHSIKLNGKENILGFFSKSSDLENN